MKAMGRTRRRLISGTPIGNSQVPLCPDSAFYTQVARKNPVLIVEYRVQEQFGEILGISDVFRSQMGQHFSCQAQHFFTLP